MSQDVLSKQQWANPKPYITKGGQGKLFPDQKPVNSVRYPRGYTPDRMRAVEGRNGKAPGLAISSAVTKKSKAAFAGPAGVGRLKQVIARSDTPAEELASPGPGQRLKITSGDPRTSRDAWAAYRSKPALGRTPGEIVLGKDPDENMMGQALMHEMGHYRSHMTGTPHYNSTSVADYGKEEAFADDNMMNRWKPDPRDVRKGKTPPRMTMAYENRSSFGKTASGSVAHRAYMKSRTTPIQKKITDKKAADENAAASFQPQMFRDAGLIKGRRSATSHPIEDWAKPDA